ncbi:hypothetical protein niasHT_003144 [Heterodera trifolii]|uniref:Uncharacterized protein n=1 Tax=Heterodera trifolii TaxID=157864 RepID=A0ABD2M3Z6_9BILA
MPVTPPTTTGFFTTTIAVTVRNLASSIDEPIAASTYGAISTSGFCSDTHSCWLLLFRTGINHSPRRQHFERIATDVHSQGVLQQQQQQQHQPNNEQ